MSLTIASLSVRGLRDNTKRREMFTWLREKHFSIHMLQEVHCTDNTNSIWSAEWGYQAIFSNYKSNKAGVCILFITILIFKSKRSLLNPRGVSSSASCDIKTNETSLTLANIYVPNEDNPAFFYDLFDYLADFKGEDIILGGDYNLVLNLDKDKKGSLSKTHENSGKIVQEFSDNLDLVDIWMVLKPDSNSFTWIQRHPRMQCRLDFFLVSQSTANITTSADIVPGYKTALSMITVHLSLHSIPRGAGFWKLNTSFLAELDYVNQFSKLSTLECVFEFMRLR